MLRKIFPSADDALTEEVSKVVTRICGLEEVTTVKMFFVGQNFVGFS